MIYLKENIESIDAVIQDMQERIYDSLGEVWGANLEAYGRAYKNHNSHGEYKPQWYIGSNQYSNDVLFNDSSDGCFFFLEGGTHRTSDELVFEVEAKIVFMLDIGRIYDENGERLDVVVQRQVIDSIRKAADRRFIITAIEKDMDSIFQGYDVSDMTVKNLQPLHTFAIVGDLTYYMDYKCD